MIATILRIGWINLRRDRVAQALTFLLPILFFSIFAVIFGHQRSPTQRLTLPVVDEDRTDYSRLIVAALSREGALDVQTTNGDNGAGAPLTRADVEGSIKSGLHSIAIVLPKGLEASRPRFGADPGAAAGPSVEILADVSDPVAPQLVNGLLQKVAFTATPGTLARDGIQMFERYTGPLTPSQQASTAQWLSQMDARQNGTTPGAANDAAFGLPTKIVNVLQPNGGSSATVSFYAAGIGVMFLLFSSSAAGGAMLDEEEAGTLGRLLGSRAGMGGVLAGKWVLVTLIGIAQLSVMFIWGALVFQLPLVHHLAGFLIVTVFTAASAAAFGLVLATMSRSRQQLSGFSTIIILSMSAVGGSMFPRFLMTATMQKIGLLTFNAWALDAYLKVFWRETSLVALWPQLAVLSGVTIVFLAIARVLARRWEEA